MKSSQGNGIASHASRASRVGERSTRLLSEKNEWHIPAKRYPRASTQLTTHSSQLSERMNAASHGMCYMRAGIHGSIKGFIFKLRRCPYFETGIPLPPVPCLSAPFEDPM